MAAYEWDDEKYARNLRKHQIPFELIYQFDWTAAFHQPDTRFDYGEDRVVAYGRIGDRGYAIVYTQRGDRVRIISIRFAHEKEMKRYGL